MKIFTSFYPFCGLGLGARGWLKARGRLGSDQARFINLGGIDNDPDACADFELLTGKKALCRNIAEVTVKELREYAGDRRPDAAFTSPPCKGFSRLLGGKKALEPYYQALNMLVYQGLFLMCEGWDEPPPLIVLENVPGIMSRGAELLERSRKLLRNYGYVFHESTHDCGVIGGLAQHRKRFLLIARREQSCRAFVYQPPKQRVKGCGEVLASLPVPGVTTEGGPLHVLPRLSPINWMRLALIPPGGDWRDLPSAQQPRAGSNDNMYSSIMVVRGFEQPALTVTGATRPGLGAQAIADPRLALGKTAAGADSFKGRPGLLGVLDWQEPSRAVTASAQVAGSNTPAAVADPRLAVNHRKGRHTSQMKMRSWEEPAGCVTGDTDIQEGAQLVADPRTLAPPDAFGNVMRVTDWVDPVGAIVTKPSPTSGAPAVADPRLSTPLKPGQARREVFARYDVRPWAEPARTVAGSGSNGGSAVQDPRVGFSKRGTMGVAGWEDAFGTIQGQTWPQNGRFSVADVRVRGVYRNGTYGVLDWEQPSGAVVGKAKFDTGVFSLADPRAKKPLDAVPVLISPHDGTWHRPLTTLELAVLQAMPATLNGKPLQLSGDTISGWRERIGNAVPEDAAAAIGGCVLKALLAHALGTWFLAGGDEPMWVRKHDGYFEPAAAEVSFQ